MIKLRQAIVVEGKYDKIRLESLVDTLIITTDGFSIFKDKEKVNMLKRIAKEKGIIIMTDSDSAGFLIRNHLSGCIPSEQITHVYIPDIFGKEKRKDAPSKERKLGVEGMNGEILLNALKQAGIDAHKTKEPSDPITKNDLYEDGYTGGADSAHMRSMLRKKYSLPDHLSTNSMLNVLNVISSREEYKKITLEIKKETDHAH